MVLTALGVSVWLSASDVQYRDVCYAVPFFIQVWLFATRVIYSAADAPNRWRPILALNPMTGVIDGDTTLGEQVEDAQSLGDTNGEHAQCKRAASMASRQPPAPQDLASTTETASTQHGSRTSKPERVYRWFLATPNLEPVKKLRHMP